MKVLSIIQTCALNLLYHQRPLQGLSVYFPPIVRDLNGGFAFLIGGERCDQCLPRSPNFHLRMPGNLVHAKTGLAESQAP